jgi:hypothetical protein
MCTEEPALRVKLFKSDRKFETAAEETVLDGAARGTYDAPSVLGRQLR